MLAMCRQAIHAKQNSRRKIFFVKRFRLAQIVFPKSLIQFVTMWQDHDVVQIISFHSLQVFLFSLRDLLLPGRHQ